MSAALGHRALAVDDQRQVDRQRLQRAAVVVGPAREDALARDNGVAIDSVAVGEQGRVVDLDRGFRGTAVGAECR